MLSEQTYNSVVLNIAIPLLEEQFVRIQRNEIKTIDDKYDIFIKVFLTTTYVLQNSLRVESIHRDFSHNARPTIIIVGGRNREYFQIPPESKEVDPIKVEETYNMFCENGFKWIAEIQKNVCNEEKSDCDIISLI